MTALVALEDVTLRFGGLAALDRVSWAISAGGIHGIIGPNGAGKSTLFNVLTGIYKPTTGRIAFAGQDVAALPTHRLARLGVARTFQNIRLLPHLSVLDNVRMVAASERDGSFWASLVGGAAARRQVAALTARARALLAKVGLADAAQALPSALPYGAQRKLELARALMRQPTLLLLDEPAAGMNATEKADLARIIRDVCAAESATMTVVLIEHDMRFVMGLCRDVTVLNQGQVLARGDPAMIQADPQVIAIYLGKPAAALARA